MTFEVGAALEDAKWQAPVYCFDKEEKAGAETHSSISDVFQQRLKEEISESFDGVLNATVSKRWNPRLFSLLSMILVNWGHSSLF